MNFKRLSSFEKQCYKVMPLIERKAELESVARERFKEIREAVMT